MCGIVGYVGHQPALDVVVDALRRKKNGTAAPTRRVVARSTGSASSRYVDAPAVGQPGERARRDRPCGPDRSTVSVTPLGHPRTPTDRNAHPPSRRGGKIAVVHNGIIENYATLPTNWRPPASNSPATPTRGGVHLSPQNTTTARRRRLHRLGAGRTAPPRGPLTLVFANADEPGTIVAARRSRPWWSASARARCSSAPTSPPSSDTPATRSSSARPGSSDHRRQLPDHRLPRQRRHQECREFYIDWDLAAAEKGGYEYFMLKEIAEQPTAVADTLLGHFVDGRIRARRTAALRSGTARDRQGVRGGLWHRVSLRSAGQVRDRALDPAACRGGTGQRVPLPRPGAGPQHAGGRHLAVGGRPPTRWKPCGMPRSRKPKSWRSATPTAPRFPGSATQCSTPAPAGDRGGVDEDVLAQITANYLVGLALAQARGTKYPDEVEREYRELEAMPDLVARVIAEILRCRAGPSVRPGVDHSVPRPPCRLSGGAEGALKLKELAYMHAEASPPVSSNTARSR